jgi:type II secretory pathway component PulK
LIIVLVALGLTAVIGGALLQMAGMERSLLAARAQESQARWLAESGVERAAAKLAGDHEYAGETWSLAEEELGVRGAGQVTIKIETDAAIPNRRRVAVEAVFPSGATSPKRYVKQVELELKP